MIDAQFAADAPIGPFGCVAQLVADEFADLLAGQVTAEYIQLAGKDALFGFGQAGSHLDRIVIDAKFPARPGAIVAVEYGAELVEHDRDDDAALGDVLL